MIESKVNIVKEVPMLTTRESTMENGEFVLQRLLKSSKLTTIIATRQNIDPRIVESK